MAGVTGVFNTGNLATDLAKKSFAGLITKIGPNGSAPLFAMTAMMKTEIASQIEHGYFSKTMVFPSVTLAAAVADGIATTLTVVSSANILPGMVLEADTTFEHVVVNSVVDATTITVTRGAGTVAAAAIANSVNLWMVGNAYEQSSLRPQALSITAVRNTNYTQIFRNTWAISDTLRQTLVIAGDTNVAESKGDCSMFHAADIEKAIFFGQKLISNRNGQPYTKMDGLVNTVRVNAAANITTLGATTTFTQLETAIDPVFDQTTDMMQGNERVMFVGGTAHRVLNAIGRLNGTYQLVDGQTTYGLQFSTFKLARGTLRVIEHPLFNAFGPTSTWAKMAVVCDIPTFNLAYLGDRKTQHEAFNDPSLNRGYSVDNGIDATGGTLTTECTSLFKNPAANAVLYNFTAGAVG